MLIFNITYLVSDKVRAPWLTWVREQHIPFMLNSNYFTQPQLARVITSAEQEGTSFSVQFRVEDMRTLKLWNQEFSAEFKEECSRQFGSEVVFFTTVLDLIDHN
ncbi:hypothetical protein Palpr_1250 [Paludibacter propionicigenes WB4]|uniref:DUF4286 domain-containing protein n=1 Tax=Paludibacter propionicigenes (strain DSM 17365 / JCM 13257 / WB4) TaxID=694427 RepID=E4T3V3_PALPW|nr:DUF4286 family protein [Paludibacter propionicigenes]ADQ79397.1 hypothetical protein Palpr_1250 [Paludibacter propionicigenes WB4]